MAAQAGVSAGPITASSPARAKAVPPGPARNASGVGTGTGLTSEQEDALDAAVGMEDDDWQDDVTYVARTLVKQDGVWYRLPPGSPDSLNESPDAGAPWEVFAITTGGGSSTDAALLVEGPIAREISGTFEVLGATGAGGVGTTAIANGRILVVPHRFPGTGTFTPASISCEVTTGVGPGTNVRLHAWDGTGTNGGPGASAYMSAAIDAASSGFKTANTSMPTLTRGVWYYFGVSSDSNPTLRTLSTSACRVLRGDTSLPTGPRSSLLRNGTTFGTPPDPWGAFASHLSAANPPVITIEYA